MGIYDDLGEVLELPPHRPTWAEINLENLIYNLNGIKKLVGPGATIIGVVKADAYGHGIEVVETLQDEGIDTFAVAFLDEAIALRQKGIDRSSIMLLGFTAEDTIPDLVEWDIEPTVYQYDFAKALSDCCVSEGCVCPVHVKVDTGMGRIGWQWHEAVEAIAQIAELPGITIKGMFTHFATADCADKTFTHLQLSRYAEVVKGLKERGITIPLKDVENSAAIMDFEKTIFNGVRPGIILYGLYPSDEVKKERLLLKPVMTFKTRIVHIKTIHAGDSLGYGRKYIATEDRVIATLPVGYADGYTRMLSGKGAEVWIKGQRAPVVGNICMDQCTIDITDLEDVTLFDEVELFGENLSVDELANKLGTINYELVCMVNKRVPRVYTFMGDAHLEVEILNSGYFGLN
ncbi:MAG: alanine racemase [Eubacteriaceae bacterium]|nr:alanine racemase [Eubacteriaceae bacterium]